MEQYARLNMAKFNFQMIWAKTATEMIHATATLMLEFLDQWKHKFPKLKTKKRDFVQHFTTATDRLPSLSINHR